LLASYHCADSVSGILELPADSVVVFKRES